MIDIKVMKVGHSWIGEIRCPVVPRVDELVQLGSTDMFRVAQVVYEWGGDDGCHPFVILDADPIPRQNGSN